MSEAERARYLATTTDKGNKRYVTAQSINRYRAFESMLTTAIKDLIFVLSIDLHRALLVPMCEKVSGGLSSDGILRYADSERSYLLW